MKLLSIPYYLLVLTGYTNSEVICPSDCPKPECLNGGEVVCKVTYEKIHPSFSYFAPKRAYLCECPAAFVGEFCEIENLCEPNPCTRSSGSSSVSTGECKASDDGSDYSCECDVAHREFLGKNCDVQDFCKTTPCPENVECHNLNGYFRCGDEVVPQKAKAAPVASVCEKYTCGLGACTPTESGYTCECPENVSGANCEVPMPCYYGCEHEGICTNVDMETKECVCTAGYSGDNCEIEDPCMSKPCQNDGVCVSDPSKFPEGGCGKGCQSDYICECGDGFTGKRCEQTDTCFYKPCQNMGRCYNQDCGESRTCVCPFGYSGENCEQEEVTTELAPATASTTPAATTTEEPTPLPPTTAAITTTHPTVMKAQTKIATTQKPTTLAPTTLAPTTVAPTTVAPTTIAPTTVAPTTVAPTTVAPTTLAPTTQKPTTTTQMLTTTTPFKISDDLDQKEVEETKNICHAHEFDLMFIVDGSGSVGKIRFIKSLQFIKNIVSVLDISANATEVSLVQYATHAKTEFAWSSNHEEIYRLVDSIEYMKAGTQTGKALMHAMDEVIPLSARHGQVPTVAMVLTDGVSHDKRANVVEQVGPKFREQVDAVFAIGVGKADYAQLEAIASSPSDHYVYNSKSWDWLNSINMQIAKKMCTVASKATTVAPTTVAPTTVAPTTVAQTTVAPTTIAPTTIAPTTIALATVAPTIKNPTTAALTNIPECPRGHYYCSVAKDCVDNDECMWNEHECSSTQTCYNTAGSYACCDLQFEAFDPVSNICYII